MMGPWFHSFVLSQVFGLYMTILSIILLSRINFYRGFVDRLEPNSPAIVITATFSLLIGLFLVVIHNIWVAEPRVIVTLVAWYILIKSILWLSFPEAMLRSSKRLYSGPGYYVIAITALIAGVFLMTKGFYLFM